MLSINILDIKQFMQLLFKTNQLDSHEFISGELTTDFTFHMDGHIQKSFFTEDELSILALENTTYLPWSMVKERLFSLIKGKKKPGQLKIVLKLGAKDHADFFQKIESSFTPSDVNGLFLNIIFQENTLRIITGISYTIFTMDQQLEADFTNYILEQLHNFQITTESC